MNGHIDDDRNGEWSEWRRLIVHEIKRINANIEKSNDRYVDMRSDITRLKLWSGIYGAVGGVVTTLLLQKIILG